MSALRRYALYWLGWTAAGLFFFTQDIAPRIYRNDPTPWTHFLIEWLAAIYICGAFTPAILWAGRRWPIDQQRWIRRAALHFLLASVYSVIELAIEAPVLTALGGFPALGSRATFARVYPLLLVYGFHGNVVRYWFVVGLQALIVGYGRQKQREREAFQLKVQSSELAAQLAGAQLSALKMQLQPHFLFNTLGAIMVLVRQGENTQAESMLARLSEMLRSTLEDVEAQEVPLWRELEFLRLYLSIEQVRFQDRLRVRIAADPTLTEALVPHMALQPIVENAIRHGLGQSEKAVLVEVETARADGHLVLTVQDDGPGSLPAAFTAKGIGLNNTRGRLERLYGAKASLAVENRRPHGVRATITLPFHLEPLKPESL